MPFQSEKQRRYMHANLPDIAKRWERDYSNGGIAELNAELNSLPEYYLQAKNQGGRIGYGSGSGETYKDFEQFMKEREEMYRGRSKQDILKEWERYKLHKKYGQGAIQEAAHGGLIPSHEAGIYGLAEGGQLVSPSKTGERPGYQGWDPGAGAPQATETQSAPPDRGPPGGGDPGMTYTAPHVPHYKEEEETKKFAIQEDIRRREEEKGGEEYYGLRDLQIKQKDLQTNIKEKIEGDWQRYMDPSTWQKVQNLYAMTNLKGIVQEIFKGIKRTSDMNAFMQDLKDLGLAGGAPGTNDPLYDQLWLHLEKGKGKYRYDDEGGPEGPQPIETSITYDDMEGYNEDQMRRASTEANTILEDARNAKRDAYLAAFRQKYLMGDTEMAAQGGRIPGGYNTGGLSNLFRLKNV